MAKVDLQLVATISDSVIFAAKSDHPNEMNFSGTLVRLDEPSTKPPNGSRGHKILIPLSLAKQKVKTLVGMGVNYVSDLDRHDPTRKVGVIKKAWIEGNAIKVSGIIWKKDFPDAEVDLKRRNLGMSFEASDIDVEDPHADVWTLKHLCFTGAAILFKSAAAYYKTDALAASASKMSAMLITKNNGGEQMANTKNKKKPSVAASGTVSLTDLTKALGLVTKPIVEGLDKLSASQSSFQKTFEEHIAASVDDEDEDIEANGDDDEDIEAGEEEEIDAAGDKKKKKKDESLDEDEDDDEDMDAEEDEEMNAGDSDDEDELEDLDEEERHVETPGKINKDLKKKGDKTTVTTDKDKHKNVAASSSVVKLSSQVRKLMATNKKQAKLIASQQTEIKSVRKQIQAAGQRTDRRSVPSTQLQNLLSKHSVDVSTLQASGEKITVAEFDQVLAAANVSIPHRIAAKSEAYRIGILDEGRVSR
jgi:hypothetical protein